MTDITRLPKQGIIVNLKLLIAISKDGGNDIILDYGDSCPIIVHYNSTIDRDRFYLQIHNTFMNFISGNGNSIKPSLSIVKDSNYD